MLAFTSLSFAGLFARMRGIASFKSCFTFTWATASDSGNEAIRLETGAAAGVVRGRVCALICRPPAKTVKRIAKLKTFFTIPVPFC
jgi:hypothetical protein